jgi:hypothetical protein
MSLKSVCQKKIREPITRLTMVRPEYCATRPAAVNLLWRFRWKISTMAMLLTLTGLFISRVGPNEVQKREQAEDKTTVFVSSQQDLNHSPVDEECDSMRSID